MASATKQPSRADGATPAGDAEAAQSQLQQALQLADELGEGIYLPHLHLLQAAIARAQGRPEAGAAPARRAVDAARTQEAPWLELLALVDLCAHQDANARERQALAALVRQLPEAAGTEAVGRARSLVKRRELEIRGVSTRHSASATTPRGDDPLGRGDQEVRREGRFTASRGEPQPVRGGEAPRPGRRCRARRP